VQIRRLMERDSCIQEQAQAKVSSQMPLEEKENLATNFIDNDSSREETHAQVGTDRLQQYCHSDILQIDQPLMKRTFACPSSGLCKPRR
jgi:dephospho-CoA kinase